MRAVRSALRAAWERPAAPGAREPRRADWVLVGVLAAVAVAEGLLRDDLARPVAATAVTVVSLTVLPWRRTHPLAAIVPVTVVGGALELVQAASGDRTVGMVTAAALVLLPYALYRWGSGRAITLGSLVLAAGTTLSVVTGGGGVEDAVGGAVVLVLAMALGETARQRAAARERVVADARLRERERIARDLHDTVAHHVSAIAVRAQAGQVSTDAGAAVDALRVIETQARLTLGEMRSLVHVLRDDPGAAPGLGGLDPLEALAGLGDAGPPAVHVHLPDEPGPLEPATATAVFRMAQEAVTNARRHARGATRVDVVLDRSDGAVRLDVHDDGAPSPRPGTGYGLAGMAERAALLGGTCIAGPDPAGGWTVRATLPAGTPRERGRVAP